MSLFKRLIYTTGEPIMALKRAFDQHDIVIPLPISTLDFGSKGGQTLRQAWPQRGEVVAMDN